jgi:glycosyltransferase involved in cell wall biosynthesis
MGRNGRAYFERHYAWEVVERKYLDLLGRLRSEGRAA